MSTSAEQYQKLWHKYQAEHDGVPARQTHGLAFSPFIGA